VSGDIPAYNNFYVFTITAFFEGYRPDITEKHTHGEAIICRRDTKQIT